MCLIDFYQVIETHGFASMLEAGCKSRPNYRDRMKNRCKLIIENVLLIMLKTETKRLVLRHHREAKTDDIALHRLILTRAKLPQRYHQILSSPADTGSEVNVVPAGAIRGLDVCGSPVATEAMEIPVFLDFVGGETLVCKQL
ncbi:Hypothetical protein PHPALM_20302 [Phytophthora palmivora]|uniref:Uncharacterized protein n=1 Tax=Phytophthora palmivora TaxID=4796 RepID=A0A2P4XF70_9STRA|nr:Hypothetical protein PHPALM_20302 [Phytophthora palmivora]